MFILINSTCFGHYYAHHQENRLCKQLHVEYAVVYIVCSPDDGHNNARNMLS